VANKEAIATDVIHTREVFFAKEGGFFIVRDTLSCEEMHKFTQVWHMAEGELKKCESGCFSTFEDANLIMIQLNNPETEYFYGSEEPFKGWNCPAYDHLLPASEVDVSLSGAGQVVFDIAVSSEGGCATRQVTNFPENTYRFRSCLYSIV